MELEVAAIGGKDSMSGSFEDIHVPPTLVSFAVGTDKVQNIVSPEFKQAGHKVALLETNYDENGLPIIGNLKENFETLTKLMREGKVLACYTPGFGGIAEAVMKMCMGNNFGFEFASDLSLDKLFNYSYANFVVEMNGEIPANMLEIGSITNNNQISYAGSSVDTNEILKLYEDKLEDIYPANIKHSNNKLTEYNFKADN